jgi:hypothetical protein
VALLLFSTIGVQVVQAAPLAKTRQLEETKPLKKTQIEDALLKRALTLNEIVDWIIRAGVGFQLSEAEEGIIRQAGKYLTNKELDVLIKSIRANYLSAKFDETIVLRRGQPRSIPYLAFSATYVRPVGESYLLQLKYPGTDKFDLMTHSGCAYRYKLGRSNFILVINNASRNEVTANLFRTTIIYDPQKGITAQQDLVIIPMSDSSIRVYAAPCDSAVMHLVLGNHIGVPNLMPSYYISEPLTVGILKHHGKPHGLITRIPPTAKDTDPITEIYYADAREIATMQGAYLPTLEQWVNAFNAGLVSFVAPSEIVSDGRGGLLIVQQASKDFPANTPFSPRIATRKVDAREPARGILRVVRMYKEKVVPIVVPNDKNTPNIP